LNFCGDFFGNDVAAFTCGDHHAGIAGAVFHNVYQRTAEKPHFKRFAVAVGQDHDICALRKIAERMSAADSLSGAPSAPLLPPVFKKSSEHNYLCRVPFEISLRVKKNKTPVKRMAPIHITDCAGCAANVAS
jgi:hypothetical protein